MGMGRGRGRGRGEGDTGDLVFSELILLITCKEITNAQNQMKDKKCVTRKRGNRQGLVAGSL